MPTFAQIISGSIMVLIGLFFFAYYRQYADGEIKVEFRLPWQKNQGTWYHFVVAFAVGLGLTGLGLSNLQMNDTSLPVMLLMIVVIRYHKPIVHVLMTFF